MSNIKRFHLVFVTRELGINKNTGGIGTYVWDLARSIVEKGHKVTIITEEINSINQDSVIIKGVNIVFLKAEKSYNPYLSPIKYWNEFKRYRTDVANKIKDINNENKVDLVEFAEFRAESLKFNGDIPSIVRWHTPIGTEFSLRKIIYYPISKIMRIKEIQCLKKSDCISFPSEWMKEKVKKFIDLTDKKYVVIPNGINMDEWKYRMSQEIITKNNRKEINIVYAGTLNARKGFYELIESVKLIRKKGYKANLYLIGRQSSYSKKIFNKYSLYNESWLHIIDPQDRDRLNEYYIQADISCFPSWFETVGIVALEAMASRSIVLASLNSGMREIIKDGENGYLVEPKDIKKLANKLEEIININYEKRECIKNNARKTIENIISNEVVSDKYLDICNQVINCAKKVNL